MAATCEGFNPEYCNYYIQQSGTGLPVYRGSRHQKGHGWLSGLGAGLGHLLKGGVRSMGRMIVPAAKSAAKGVLRMAKGPIAKKLAGKALKTGLKIGADLLGGRSMGMGTGVPLGAGSGLGGLRTSLAYRLPEAGYEVIDEVDRQYLKRKAPPARSRPAKVRKQGRRTVRSKKVKQTKRKRRRRRGGGSRGDIFD